ncbi:potassium-transporting ATPase subunit KdpC [Chitinasiproducens palmae]|uniref:Potassium-transporting ATPase KdpC subunit n=1 Tax=Chitinasiproducens palmae TaxID=1770053 RepID=A0A1H2PMU8_9BURK|nr:potassium-transporting ATPase subunit KdpC [Chitinasiproducens palmae]SDV47084.1 K+-transporting ATPase ATPase C chain [Chitinasiproducens palmae]
MRSIIRPVCVVFAALLLLTGAAYPALVTAIAQLAFPSQANGSLLRRADGQAVGSALIGQSFDAPGYFWGRPSATAPMPYNAQGSSGSNLGPTNPALTHVAEARIAALRDSGGAAASAPVPVDLVTASASGLDPEISPAAARYQTARVAAARHLSRETVDEMIERNTRKPWLGLFGEAGVNVLKLNLELDAAVSPR